MPAIIVADSRIVTAEVMTNRPAAFSIPDRSAVSEMKRM
jgi:hypothetical protein